LPNLELKPQGISYREREREDFRVAKKAETPNFLLGTGGSVWGAADTCKAWVAQLVSNIFIEMYKNDRIYIENNLLKRRKVF
jgi:hypothetical protein